MKTLYKLRCYRLGSVLCCQLMFVHFVSGIEYKISGHVNRLIRFADGGEAEPRYEAGYTLTDDRMNSLATGDSNFRIRAGYDIGRGRYLFPSGTSTTLRDSRDTFERDEATGMVTITGTLDLPIIRHVPRGIDLRGVVEVNDHYGNGVARFLSEIFQEPDDGMNNSDRADVSVNLVGDSINFTNGIATADFEATILNARLAAYFEQVQIEGLGVGSHQTTEFVAQDGVAQRWLASSNLYRRDAAEFNRELLANFFLEDGATIRTYINVPLTGDAVPDTTPPVVTDFRWRTEGDQPTVLGLNHLFGRYASTRIYAQLEVQDETAVDDYKVRTILKNDFQKKRILPPISFSTDIGLLGRTVVYQSEVYVPNDIKWNSVPPVSMADLIYYVQDVWGNETIGVGGQVGLSGPQEGDDPPDTNRPVAEKWTINAGIRYDLQDGTNEIPATVTASDMGLGVDSIYLSYKHPVWNDSLYFSFSKYDIAGAEGGSQVYSGNFPVGRYLASGTYMLDSASIIDLFGNTTTFDVDDPDLSMDFQKEVEIGNTMEDLDYPGIGPVTFEPSTVDVSEESATVKVKFRGLDLTAGISYGSLQLGHNTDKSFQPLFASIGSFNRVSGDGNDGEYEAEFTVPAGAPAGELGYQIQLVDMASRSSYYGMNLFSSSFEFMPLPEGSAPSLSIVNSSMSETDTVAPLLKSISIVDGTDFANASGFLTATLEIEETGSGLWAGGGFFGGFNYVHLRSPTGAYTVRTDFSSLDKTEGDMYSFQIPVNHAVEPGQYWVEVFLRDNRDNAAVYGLGQFQMPFPGNFPGRIPITNSGIVDYSGPVATQLKLTPQLAASGDSLTVGLEVQVVDSGLGIASGNLSLKNGTDTRFGFRNTLWSTVVSPPETDESGTGTANDARYNFQIPILESVIMGDFLSVIADFTDVAGNRHVSNSSIFNYSYGIEYPFPRNYGRIPIVAFASEQDYMAFANEPNTFPEGTPEEKKAMGYDFDYDGFPNIDEFVFGTNLADQSAYPKVWIDFESGVGTTVHFQPFLADRQYQLIEGLQGKDQEVISEVPILGDLPLAGKFFTSQKSDPERRNLLILVRPTLVNF